MSFCDYSNLLKNPSANCLIESNVKLISLGVEADEAAAVAVVDGFGSGGANVGMTNLSFSNTPCRVFPKACKQFFLGLHLLLLECSLELLAALLRYVFILDVDGRGIYLGGVRLFTGH